MPSYPSNAAYPAALDPLDPKVTADNGGDFSALLQPEHQAEYSETPADIAAALVAAGIMKPNPA